MNLLVLFLVLAATNAEAADPVLEPIPDQSMAEGESLNIPLSATDDDPADTLTFSATGLPVFCVFSDNGDGTADIDCDPVAGQSGSFDITVAVTDGDAVLPDPEQTFTLDVNAAPVLTLIPDQSMAEGESLNIPLSAEDDDPADALTFSATGLPAFCQFASNPNRTGDIDCDPVAGQSGSFDITVTVTDNDLVSPGSDQQTFNLDVNAVPVLEIIPDQLMAEGESLNIPLSATDDDDGDALTFSATGLPVFCQLTSNPDRTGDIDCDPGAGQSGSFDITVTVTDNDLVSPGSDQQTFALDVSSNALPVLAFIPDQLMAEGESLNIPLSATDADAGDTLTFSATGLPVFCQLTSNPDRTADIDCNPGPGQGGGFSITVTVVDNAVIQGSDEQTFTLAVSSNAVPVLAPISDQSMIEGELLNIGLSATDADIGDTLTFSATGLPAFCQLISNPDRTGDIDCNPIVGDAGIYPVTVTVTDSGVIPASASGNFTLEVTANQAPTAINVSITGTPQVGQTLTGEYTYDDAENDPEGTSTFRWLRGGIAIPNATGITYVVSLEDKEETLRFEVTPVAQSGVSPGDPVLSAGLLISNTAPSITGQNVVEMQEDTSREIVLADLLISDVDDNNCQSTDDCTLVVLDGANYTHVGNTITPDLNFDQTLTVPVLVNDGSVDSGVFNLSVTVTPVNDAPSFIGVLPPGLSTPEDTTLTISVTALEVEDPDSDPSTFVLTLDPVVPPDANYTLAGPASITPAENFNGDLSVRATVSDGELDSAPFLIPVTVTAENDLPVLEAEIGPQTAIENSLFELATFGNFSDADGDTLTFSATGLPASNSITIDPVTGLISGTPTVDDARDNAPYVVTVTATDPEAASVSDEFELTISALDRANIGLSIGVTPESGLPNEQLTWTFTAGNPIGPAPGENVELTGSFFGEGLSVAAGSGSSCSINLQTGRADFVCTIGALPVGGTTSVSFTTTASQATEVVAFGTAAGAQLVPIDPNISDNSAVRAVGVAESFSDGAVQFLGASTIRSVAAGDFNGDGRVDLVVGTAAGQPVQVYLAGDPRESCGCPRDFVATPISIPDTGSNEGIAVADFDNDGNLDFVVANGGGQPDAVYHNTGSGNFAISALLAPSNGRDVAVGDFNNDGNVDIAIAATSPNPVYFGDGTGSFGAGILLGDVESFDVAVGRFDNDLFDDLVFANVGSDSQVWINNGGTGFTPGTTLPIGDAVAVAAADLNGDNLDDLVFGRIPGDSGDVPSNPVLINQGGATFGGTPQLLGISPTVDVLIGDVSDDGLPDLVFVNQSGVHQIWTASGGSFVLHAEQIIDIGARAGVVADLGFADTDDPGGADLALGGALGAGTAVYLNDSAGNLGLGDAVAPVITLNGAASVDVPSGTAYSDAGAAAIDNIDGDITASIVVSNAVNTAAVGSYTVTYNVQDFAGNAAVQVTRTVNVTAAVGRGGGGGGALDYWAVALLAATWVLLLLRSRAELRRGMIISKKP